MYSEFKTPKKTYFLKTDKYVCNKFGLAEFFALSCEKLNLKKGISVLDAGCGVFPLGIFFASQYDCYVTGVELNHLACKLARENIKTHGIENKAKILEGDFSKLVNSYSGANFDLIVANPPIDTKISENEINRFSNTDFFNLDDETFSYLTNSWHSSDGRDFLDFIFEIGQKNLTENGKIIITFCTIDLDNPEYVSEKAKMYDFGEQFRVSDFIEPESIGAQNHTKEKIKAFTVCFTKGKDIWKTLK